MAQPVRKQKDGTTRKKHTAGTKRTPRKRPPLALRIAGHFGSVIVTTLLSFFLIFVIVGSIVGTALVVYILGFMESTNEVSIHELEMSYSTFIYAEDSEGELVELRKIEGGSGIKRLPMDIEDIPQHVLDAFVYAEDARFYTHDGVDYKSTIAALANTFLEFWDTERGGSTITQQLIKNITGDDDISAERKIREIFRAMQLEKNYTKEEILEAYLNYIGFGGSANGIKMASLKYFGKEVHELTVAEAACLAAIPKSPEVLNPFANPERNRERQLYVLGAMYKYGAITFDEYQAAVAEDLIFTNSDEYKELHPEDNALEDAIEAEEPYSWVVDAAINEYADVLVEDLGISRSDAITRINEGGYQIYTTVDLDMQAAVEEKFMSMDNILKNMATAESTKHKRDLDGDGVYSDEEAQYLQAGFAAIDYTGAILATVGGIGEKTGSLSTSYAYEPQQPGSTIKPVTTYALGFYNDTIHWGAQLPNKGIMKINGKSWPVNYGNTVGGGNMLHMYFALQKSYNTIPAQICKELGTTSVFNFATDKLGLELNSYDNDYAPLCVGGLNQGVSITNLTNAYMVYGNGGQYSKAHIISYVTKGDGTLVYTGGLDINQAIDSETATVMNKMLLNVVNHGTGTQARLTASDGTRIPIAGKTGTTTDWYDLTFVGLCPDFVSGVWIGYKDNAMIQRHGALNSSHIWRNIIGDYIKETYTGNDFYYDENVISAAMCTATGNIAASGCPKGVTGYWKSSNAPVCTGHGTSSEDVTTVIGTE